MEKQKTRGRSRNTVDPAEVFGDIYAITMLDHLVEAAVSIAHELVEQPSRFGELPEDILATLESFRTLLGQDPEWPDSAQRGAIFDSFLAAPFTAASAAFRLAVVRFAEGGTNANRSLHVQALQASSSALKDLLEPSLEQATRTGHVRLSGIFRQAVKVLRNKQIRQTFGVSRPSDKRWPLESDSAAESGFLDAVFNAERSTVCQSWGPYYFSTLQRVAVSGRMALICIMEEPRRKSWEQSAFEHGDRWTRALNDLLPVQSIIRAWREPPFTTELTDAQRRHLPPDPAGEIDTTNAKLRPLEATGARPAAAGQTFTVNNEVCCSTTPSVSCMSHCPPPEPGPIIIGAPSTFPCCTHHC